VLFWTGICDQADDVTVYLGYRPGKPEWPSAPAVRSLTLHHTVVCRSAGEPEKIYLPARLDVTGKENFKCGPGERVQLTPNITRSFDHVVFSHNQGHAKS